MATKRVMIRATVFVLLTLVAVIVQDGVRWASVGEAALAGRSVGAVGNNKCCKHAQLYRCNPCLAFPNCPEAGGEMSYGYCGNSQGENKAECSPQNQRYCGDAQINKGGWVEVQECTLAGGKEQGNCAADLRQCKLMGSPGYLEVWYTDCANATVDLCDLQPAPSCIAIPPP